MSIITLIVALASLVSVYADTMDCPGNLSRSQYLRRFGNSCYEFIFSHPVDWSHAESYCKTHGGHLVSIGSLSEQAFVYNSLQVLGFHNDKGVWIGLTDQRSEGHWIWSSNEPVSYRNWASGQPGLFSSAEDCALMEIGDKGHWHDYPCHGFLFSIQNHGWICEYAAITPSSTKLPATSAPTKTTTAQTTVTPSTTAQMVETRRTDAPTTAPVVETRATNAPTTTVTDATTTMVVTTVKMDATT